jgi:hypothetical protein
MRILISLPLTLAMAVYASTTIIQVSALSESSEITYSAVPRGSCVPFVARRVQRVLIQVHHRSKNLQRIDGLYQPLVPIATRTPQFPTVTGASTAPAYTSAFHTL